MKKTIDVLLICILLVCAFFAGKHLALVQSTAPGVEGIVPAERNLRISVTADKDANFTTIPLEQGNYKKIAYLDVTNVTIDIGATSMTLEDAILEGCTSVDELIACARLDASLGFCNEVAKSRNGLTEFTYHYREFSIHYVYDLYEAPDGRQQLITDFLIYGAGSEPHFLPMDEETGDPIHYNDWGLTFEAVAADSTSLTIDCTQSGGQQLGALTVDHYWIYLLDDAGDMFDDKGQSIIYPPGYTNPDHGNHFGPLPDIPREADTRFTLNWSELYGELPEGRYTMHLSVRDDFEKSQMGPQMRNFHNRTDYWIEFTIS